MLLWIPAIGVGARILLQYSATPGRLATPPQMWPHNAGIQRANGGATLVVFAHPHCPCSRATVEELALIIARCRGKVEAFVFFYIPRSERANWARTDLWRSAAIIPGVRPMEDPDGNEARRFGAATSGQTLLYDGNGRLLFNGGITASRGHMGANDGWDAIVSLLETGTAKHKTTPVFGCSLLGPE